MARKIMMKSGGGRTYAEVFSSFITAQTARGISDITIRNYRNNLHTISKYLDVEILFDELTNEDLEEIFVA